MARSGSLPEVALGNEEAVRAWDTVLYDRWKKNRKVFVGALDEVTDKAFELYPPPEGGSCIDIGCGFGETTVQMAGLVGPEGFALGTDSSPHFIRDAINEAADSGAGNVAFEVADAQVADWPPAHEYAFSRMGTQFFAAPVPAMRVIRGSLKPEGKLCKICWQRKEDSALWAETEKIVERFLDHPEESDADTCGPGPFSLGNPETCRGILEAAGFEDVEIEPFEFDYYMGGSMDEAVEAATAIGPGAELIRLNGDFGESRRPEIEAALVERFTPLLREDGSVFGRAAGASAR